MARMYRLSPSEQRHWTRGGPATTLAGFVLAAMLGVPLPAEVDAQETDPAPVRVTLNGVVFDALTRTPIPGAAVYLEEEGYGVLADSLGTFGLENVAVGPHVVTAIQFGYEEIAASIDVPEAGAILDIELTPLPILLDGVTAVVDNITTMQRRLRSRRRSAPYQTRAFDQERLLRSASVTALEFVKREAGLLSRPCPASSMSTRCIFRRGRVLSPRVFIDEIPVFRGLDALDSYPTAQIYMLEVFSAGSEIRAYTYNFMRRMASKPRGLIPLNMWP